MSSQAYGRNDERIITKRKFHGEFPNHPSITPIHVGAIGKDTAPFNQSHNHIPAPPHAPDFSPTGMTNPNVTNYSPAYNGQYHPPNSYPHSAMPVPYNHFLPNNPTATNLYPPHPPQMWGGVIPHTTAPYTFVQQPTKPMAPLVVPKVSQKTSDNKNTTPPPPKSAIRKEPHQSQKTPSHAILHTKSMTQNKPHSTAAGGEPITNDDTTQNPARAAAPATTTQSDKNNNEEGKASIQGEESKVKPSDESLPSQSVEKKAKENKKIKETKNKPPPVSLPPIVVAEVIPSEEKIDKSSVAFAYEIGNKKSEKHKKIKETKIISSQSPPIVVGEAIPLELMENIDKRSVAFAFKIGSKKSERCANAAESKWKSQQSLKCIVTSSHQPANISSSCSTATTHATVSHMNYTPPLEVFNGPAPDLPTGWTLQKLQRTGGATRNRIDRYWYSPTKKKFRSTVEIKKFMTALDMTKGDEEEAFKLFKKGSIVT